MCRASCRDAAVHQVAGHGDHVRLQTVHRIDDSVQVLALDRRADVDVADLGDAEAVQRRGEVRDRDVHAFDASAPARVDETGHGGERGEDGYRDRAVVAESFQRRWADGERDVADQREDE